MLRKILVVISLSVILATIGLVVFSRTRPIASSAGTVLVTKMLGGLESPWGIGFLPNGDFLVTERKGNLLYVKNGKPKSVRNAPDTVEIGQGGMLDLMIPRDFARTRDVFITYAKKVKGGYATALDVGQLSGNGRELRKRRTIFVASPGSESSSHFGSRVVEARDGTLFVTLGERNHKMDAQDRSKHAGSVIRINRDGSVPTDNPFVGRDGMRPEIWSYGHRNPQGAALDMNGRLWVAEHGAKGGDEINLIRKGANYGWPIISYGVHYSGDKIGEGTKKSGMEQPVFYWDPSIAPSGLMIYSGKLWPEWQGHSFVGSLKFHYISRLAGKPMREIEQLKTNATHRVRHVAEAPDGSIWFLSEGKGAIYRMTPVR